MSPEDRTCLSCLETFGAQLVVRILTELAPYTEVSGEAVCTSTLHPSPAHWAQPDFVPGAVLSPIQGRSPLSCSLVDNAMHLSLLLRCSLTVSGTGFPSGLLSHSRHPRIWHGPGFCCPWTLLALF